MSDNRQSVMLCLTRLVSDAKATIEKPNTRIGWQLLGELAYAQAVLDLVCPVLRYVENGETLEESLDGSIEEITSRLLNNSLKGGSTSQFANALEATAQECHSRMLQAFKSYRKALAKEVK